MVISDKLMNKILNKKVEIIGFKDKYIPSSFEYIQDMIDVKSINIYELMHLCKVYASSKGYEINSSTQFAELINPDGTIEFGVQANTEYEAVFNIGDYLIEEIEK